MEYDLAIKNCRQKNGFSTSSIGIEASNIGIEVWFNYWMKMDEHGDLNDKDMMWVGDIIYIMEVI